ncbi:MAG: hypothetical protein ABI704_05840 [Kofleriaceae bacterium]
MCDVHQHAIHGGNELEAEIVALPPGRLFELGLRYRFDPEVLHGLRERIVSTAARACATESSREASMAEWLEQPAADCVGNCLAIGLRPSMQIDGHARTRPRKAKSRDCSRDF